MTDTLAARIAAVTTEHSAARRAAGITRKGGMTKLAEQRAAGTIGDALAATGREDKGGAALAAERARHAEAARLFTRAAAVQSEIDALDGADAERAARLDVLRETIMQRRASYIDATYQVQATEADWAPGGRFDRYARRYDLGFIAYSPADIAQDAAESLALRHHHKLLAGEPVLSQGETAANGSRTLPHTLGEGYRAVKSAYRRGLGFYGYERRGTVVDRDDSPRGYSTHESESVAYIREAGERDAQIRAAMTADIELTFTADTPETEALAATVLRRQAALSTLARRFPLTADARQLALATLLAEGYTVAELTGHPAMPSDERTLQRWASELGQLVA